MRPKFAIKSCCIRSQRYQSKSKGSSVSRSGVLNRERVRCPRIGTPDGAPATGCQLARREQAHGARDRLSKGH